MIKPEVSLTKLRVMRIDANLYLSNIFNIGKFIDIAVQKIKEYSTIVDVVFVCNAYIYRNEIIEQVQKNYPFQAKSKRKKGRMNHSGLMILSKYQIEKKDNDCFLISNPWEFYETAGYINCTINLRGNYINIMNAYIHQKSNPSKMDIKVSIEQTNELVRFIDVRNTYPLIVCVNSNAYQYFMFNRCNLNKPTSKNYDEDFYLKNINSDNTYSYKRNDLSFLSIYR